MMKKCRILLFVTACLAVVFSVFVGAGMQASAETYGDLTYTVSDGEVTITRCKTSATTVTIPETIDGYPVTGIGAEAFRDCTVLTKINWNAKNVSDLTSSSNVFRNAGKSGNGIEVIFSDTVESIPAYLFYVSDSYYRPKITSVTIGDSVTSIGPSAFYGCSSLPSVTIGKSVTSIGSSAFRNCTALTRINWNAANVSDLTASSNVFYNAGTSGDGIEVIFGNMVESIPAYLFYISESSYRPKITSVTISESVTNIGSSAFYYCTGLTSVTIPDSVTSIGSSAFYYCSGLTSVTIGNSVTSIGSSVFKNCTGLTSVSIPESVTSIASQAFYGCKNLRTISVSEDNENYSSESGVLFNKDKTELIQYPIGKDNSQYMISSGIIRIASYAFDDCDNLVSVIIPDSVTSIGSSAFYGCSSLTSVTIGKSVTNIGSYAFENCTALTRINWNAANVNDLTYSSDVFYNAGTSGNGIKVIFGDTVESIPANLFYLSSSYSSSYRPKITSVTIGESVTSIGSYAFYHCTGLTSVTFPESVTSIGSYAFVGCTKLTKIQWDAKNVSDLTSSSKVFYNAGTSGDGIEVIFGDTVESIPAYLFYVSTSDASYSPKITSVTFGESVTSIGSSAFYGCSSLTSVTIGKSVTGIGSSAFSNCSSLTSAIISNSVTSIGSSAFSNCSSLTSAIISNSVTSIGSYAFRNCTALTRINWNAANVGDLTSSSYVFYNAGTSSSGIEVIFGDMVESIPAYLFYISESSYRPKITSVTISESVTNIGASAFYDCTGLTSVTIGNSVTSIGSSAFYYCTGLTSVTIGNSVTSIGSSAFNGCRSLTSVTIPDSVTSIGSSAFSGCSSLTSVTIGDSVTSIGDYAFDGLSSLKAFYVDVGNTSYVSVDGVLFSKSMRRLIQYPAAKEETRYTVPDSVYRFSSRAFKNQAYLEEIVMNDNITILDDYVFSGCQELKTVTMPSALTSIGKYAFYKCASLTNITIPDSVTSIGDYAFFKCASLMNITIPASVKQIGSYAFQNCSGLQTVVWNTKHIYSCNNVFSGAGDIQNGMQVIFGDGVTMVPECIFNCDSRVKSVVLSDTVKTIGYHAFMNASTLSEIDLPDGLQGIYEKAFYGCNSLKEISLPESVTSVGSDAFSGCTGMTDIYVYNPKLNLSSTGLSLNTTIHSHTGYAVETFANQYAYDFEALHIPGEEWVTTATCTQPGEKYHPCKYCDEKFDVQSAPATGHTGGTATCHSLAVCTVCGEAYGSFDPNNHAGGTEVRNAKSATCGANGYTGDTYCKGCGVKLSTGSTIYATGNHNYKSTVTKTATCKATGVRTYTCSICGDTYTETIAKDSSNHTGGTEVRNAKSATCGANGYTGDTYCLGCGVKLSTGSTIYATGNHNYKSTVTKTATCKATGVRTYTCSVCGDTYTETIAKDSSNHTGGTEVRNAKSATCGANGYTGDVCCKDCGVKLSTGSVIPATGKHNYKSTVTKTATCKATGVRTYTCSVCGDSYTTTIAKDSSNHTGGTEVRNVKSATCGANGYTGDTYCKGCGVKLSTGSTVPATGYHNYSSKVTTAATCISTGVKTFTCSVCGDSYTETIAKDPANHVGNAEVRNAKPASCGENGYTGDVCCKDCGVKLTSGSVIPATGKHDYTSKVTKAATCKDTGVRTYTCSVCGDSYTETIAKDSSNHVGGTEIRNASATYTGDTYCKGCGVMLQKGTSIDVSCDHHYVGEVTKAATCKDTGIRTYTCSLCGASYTETIAKDSSNHVGGTEIRNASATYTGDTYCKGCGVMLQKGTSIDVPCDHHYVGEVTKAATCNAFGVKIYTCSLCGDSYTEELPKDPANHAGGTEVRNAKTATCLETGYTGDTYCKGCGTKLADGKKTEKTGHSETEIPAKPATCTEPGLTAGTKCSVCGEILTAQESIRPDGHHFGDWMTDKKATFLTSGTERRICSACGQKDTREIPVLVATREMTNPDTGYSVLYTESAFPGEISLEVMMLTEGDIYQSVKNRKGNYRNLVFNLSTAIGGETTEPDETVLVRLPIPNRFHTEKLCVYLVKEDGSLEKMSSYVDNTGALYFQTEHSGAYAVVDESAEIPPYVTGDLDEDGVVTAADARLALRIAASLEAIGGEAQYLAADIDEDGTVTATDARKILRVAAQIDRF